MTRCSHLLLKINDLLCLHIQHQDVVRSCSKLMNQHPDLVRTCLRLMTYSVSRVDDQWPTLSQDSITRCDQNLIMIIGLLCLQIQCPDVVNSCSSLRAYYVCRFNDQIWSALAQGYWPTLSPDSMTRCCQLLLKIKGLLCLQIQ